MNRDGSRDDYCGQRHRNAGASFREEKQGQRGYPQGGRYPDGKEHARVAQRVAGRDRQRDRVDRRKSDEPCFKVVVAGGFCEVADLAGKSRNTPD